MKKTKYKHIIKTILLIIFWLITVDVMLQLVLSISFFQNTKIKQYFDYGLSVESQIRKMIENDKPNSVLHAGWFDKEIYKSKGEVADITLYGMSFSDYVGNQLQELAPEMIIRTISGPASPLNHSFYAYTIDKEICKSDYAVLGILDSSIKYLEAMTNDTIGVDSPYGSFYPRYFIDGTNLNLQLSTINTFLELKESIYNKSLWGKQLETLRVNDANYNNLIYKSNILDFSIIGRLIKRWYKTKHNKSLVNRIHTSNGFNLNRKSIRLANLIVMKFAQEARENDSIPIILLFHTQGYGDHLFTAFENTISQYDIPYISTHNIFSVSDPKNFIRDGHYTDRNYNKIALDLLNLVNKIKGNN